MIMFCKDCNNRMNLTYHFEDGKASTYYLCKKCYCSTKPKIMDVNKVFGDRNSEEDKKISQNSKGSTVKKNSKMSPKYSKGVNR